MPGFLRPKAKDTSEKKKNIATPCSEGSGWGRKQGEEHEIKFQSHYDDPTRGLKNIRLTPVESKAAYTCRHCESWQGCASCIDDVASLVCSQCHDWANEISVKVHGRMIRHPELKQHGIKLVMMLYAGQINRQEYDKLWAEACAVLRMPANLAKQVSNDLVR